MTQPARAVLDWWLCDRRTGNWVIGQWPNPAIWVFAIASVVAWSPFDWLDPQLRLVGSGALIVWGADELFRGVNPFRRVLGGSVLLWQLVHLFRT